MAVIFISCSCGAKIAILVEAAHEAIGGCRSAPRRTVKVIEFSPEQAKEIVAAIAMVASEQEKG